MNNNKIIFTSDVQQQINQLIQQIKPSQTFIITDNNVNNIIIPQLPDLQQIPKFVFPAGEKSKNIQTAIEAWNFLTKHNADRNSLIINIGGGVVSDLGGFIASTFKRGIKYINIPTSLLAQVDASVGGKTAINLQNYKNIIGCFSEPFATIINPNFLKTLPKRHLIAGYAEMIKHALIAGETEWTKIKSFPIYDENIDYDFLGLLIKRSIEIKKSIVELDPKEEKGPRKILNFGHTIAHALETFFANKGVDILHGEAVAIGIIAETYLSNLKFILDVSKVFEISSFVSSIFPSYRIPVDDYQQIIEIMLQDKKNKDGEIRFTLLKKIGEPAIDQTCTPSEIKEALNFYYQFSQ